MWQKAMTFVTEIYKTTKLFPKTEQYGLTSQIQRSAVSVPSNIAEGYGRQGLKDYLRFLNIGLASLFELQTQIEFSYNLEYVSKEKFKKLNEQSREIERMLSSLIRKLKQKR